MSKITSIDLVVDKAGGAPALSKSLGITIQAISGWRKRGYVPSDRIYQIVQITGLEPEQVRPDLFADIKKARNVSANRASV